MMRKKLLIVFLVLVHALSYSAGAFAADKLPMTTGISGMTPAQNPPVMDNPYGQDIEQLLKTQENFLRKVKEQHETKDRKHHVIKTEKSYRQAVTLYHQKRSDQARDTFKKVEDAMADYKSTLSYLKVIDERSIENLRASMLKIRKMKGTEMVIGLLDQASALYTKAAYLADDKYFIMLSYQLGKLNQVLQEIKCEKVKAARQLNQQDILDQMAKQASDYDQQIVKLIGTKDYQAAKQKYDEFQKVMTHRLIVFKQEFRPKPMMMQESLFHKMYHDKGYRSQEQATFLQALGLYKQKQFFEAKGIFNQLADQGDPRAVIYSKKIDRLLE